jgi:hypothetical protein
MSRDAKFVHFNFFLSLPQFFGEQQFVESSTTFKSKQGEP